MGSNIVWDAENGWHDGREVGRQELVQAFTRPNREQREAMKADGIVCTLCRYYGLGHDGDHLLPANGAGAVLSALSKRTDQ